MGKTLIKTLLAFITTVIILIIVLLLSSNTAAYVSKDNIRFNDNALTASVRLDYGSREHIKDYAKERVENTFGENQWNSFDKIVVNESGWNCQAQNPTSTAFGCFQFLNSTWIGTGIEKTSDPFLQIDAGIIYIKNRYGNPNNAYQFWKENKWY